MEAFGQQNARTEEDYPRRTNEVPPLHSDNVDVILSVQTQSIIVQLPTASADEVHPLHTPSADEIVQLHTSSDNQVIPEAY